MRTWQIVVAAIALVVTTVSVTFAATAAGTLKNLRELEPRVRSTELLSASNTTLMRTFESRLVRIENKLDQLLGAK
uniref:Uncharacterized protein n=1 Tax=viral metagenome TaxID=1070528 RepID=A0A6M3LNP4_9ZZZZ